MDNSKRILGIEGGGTKTEWVLFDGNTIADRGRLHGSNLRLCTDAELARMFEAMPPDATHVGVFLAACGTDADRERLRTLATAAWPQAAIVVGSDRDSGLATAFRDEDGIVVIAGTGAAVHGRNGTRIEKAGGWGHVLGDRGGGYDLARQGLRVVLSNYDLEQRITPLAERILRDLALNSLTDLGTWAMEADKMSVARLAPAIFEAARFGEREMLETITAGAQILAEFTRAVAQRLGVQAPRVKMFGGLFVHHPDYVSLFKLRLSVLLPQATAELCAESGAIGAAWLAARGGDLRFLIADLKSPPAPALEPEIASLKAAATEQRNPRSEHLDQFSNAQLVEIFIEEEKSVAGALAKCREDLVAALDLTATAMIEGGRLFYVGAGSSGRLGVLDASEIPPTFGAPHDLVQGIIAGGVTALHRAVEGAEDEPAAGALAVAERGVRAGDVVCGITASRRTPFVLGALQRARELGARTLLLTSNPARGQSVECDVSIDLPTGPEIVTGSTRLKAGTATKVVLNLLSTGAMVRLGHVRGNAMIDLHISNEKLRDRGTRLVSETLGVGYDEARRRLEAAKWNVRAVIDAG
jgi:N-acetylmuramic acid 6-phosphate etherase